MAEVGAPPPLGVPPLAVGEAVVSAAPSAEAVERVLMRLGAAQTADAPPPPQGGAAAELEQGRSKPPRGRPAQPRPAWGAGPGGAATPAATASAAPPRMTQRYPLRRAVGGGTSPASDAPLGRVASEHEYINLLETALAEREEENKRLRLRSHWTAKLLHTLATLREELEEARARQTDALEDARRMRELCREKDDALAVARGEAANLKERVAALEKAKASSSAAAEKERGRREEAESTREDALAKLRHLHADLDALKSQHGSALETKLKADKRAEAATAKAAKLQAKLDVEIKARARAEEEVGNLDERLGALRRRNRQLEAMAAPTTPGGDGTASDAEVLGGEVQRLRGELALREEECSLLAALVGAKGAQVAAAPASSEELSASTASPIVPTPRSRPAPVAEARTPATGLPEPPAVPLMHPPPSAATLRAFEKLAERLREDDESSAATPGFHRFLA